MKKFRIVYLVIPLLLILIMINYNNNINTDNNEIENNNIVKVNNVKSKFLSMDESEDEPGISLYYFVSSPYDLSKSYIYVKDDSDFVIKSNIRLVGGTVVVEDGKIKFMQGDYLLKEFTLVRVTMNNLKMVNGSIVLTNNISYEEFVSNIMTENATYKIFDDNTEISYGYIESGMKLKIYYGDDEVDSYNITDEYLDLSKLNIRGNKYIMVNISTVSDLKQLIDTSGNIIINDQTGNILEDNDYLKTNSKVKIKLSNNSYEYTIVVLGDVTGSGDIFIGDISKLYQYYKGILSMDECYVLAGDVSYDGVIEINDIAKLYQYYKGVIDSL